MRHFVTFSALAAMTASAWAATAARAEDRYGPPPAEAGESTSPGMLNWPGKTQQAAAPAPADQANSPAASLYGAAHHPGTSYAPVYAAPTAPPPAMVRPQPPVAAGPVGAPPRYYSLHRQYGLQPDPVALSPRFAADSGGTDLAEPPPPPPPHANAAQTANMSPSAAAHQARAAAEAALDGGLGGPADASN